jgi:hypothetical protein
MGSNAGHLLDTTPGSPGGKNDAGILIGRTKVHMIHFLPHLESQL